jgi:hypothetical protein
MANYHITIVRPPGYLHSDCFREAAEALLSALGSLGHGVELGENTFHPDATNILFGTHLLSEQEARRLPAASILYNLEQLGGAHLPPWYVSLASHFRIWDYSPLNLARWNQVTCLEPPALVELGYAPELQRIPSASVQDIDVLFYGSLNERRSKILRELDVAGVKVHYSFGVYGAQRDRLIGRAKIVLNLHAYPTELFEIVRVSYLLANAKAVVTETSPDLGSLADAVAACPYDELVKGCITLLEDEAERRALEARGFRLFSARSQARILQAIVGPAIADAPVVSSSVIPDVAPSLST